MRGRTRVTAGTSAAACGRRTNLNKRDITLDLTSDEGRDLVRRLVARGRRRRGELLTPGDRAVRAGLRVAGGAQAGRDPGAHARVRAAGAVARIRRLGVQLRADIGDVGGDGLRRRPAVQPAGTRRSHRRGARRGRAAGRARASAPHRRGPAHRDRADRGRGVRDGRAGDRVLDERRSCGRARAIGSAGYVQGVYPTAVDGAWVAISVRDDADWAQLATAMGRPELLDDARFASADERELAHDEFDEMVADWTRTQTAAEIVEALSARHVPAEQVITRRPDVRHPPTRRAGILRRVRAPDHGAAPLSRLAVHDDARTRPPPPVRDRRRSDSTTTRSCGGLGLTGERARGPANATGDRRDRAQRIAL